MSSDADSLLQIARNAAAAGQHADAYAAFAAAKAAYELADSREGVARTLLAEGELLRNTGQLESALARLNEAVAATAGEQNLALAGDIARGLGAVYLRLRMNDDAVRCYRQARTAYKDAGDKVGEARALNNLASASVADSMDQDSLTVDERGKERFAVATEIWKESADLAQLAGDQELFRTIRYNMSLGLDLSGKHEEALAAASELAELEHEAKRVEHEVRARNLMGQALINLGEVDRATAELQTAVALAREHSLVFLLEDALQTLATAQEANFDISGALETLQHRLESIQARSDETAITELRRHMQSLEKKASHARAT
jgi:tetratricopeptide (TPR) repeat protein